MMNINFEMNITFNWILNDLNDWNDNFSVIKKFDKIEEEKKYFLVIIFCYKLFWVIIKYKSPPW